MKVFVVNLDRDVERMASCKAQLDRLGVQFERLSAVYAKEEIVHGTLNLNQSFDRFGWWCAMGYEMRLGELGCAMSHNLLYHRMLEHNIPMACVLEDDVLVNENLPTILRRLETDLSGDRKTIVHLTNYTDFKPDCPGVYPSRQNQSTEAYVITRSAAAEILRINEPVRTPSDRWLRFSSRGGIEMLQAWPLATDMHRARFGSYTDGDHTQRVADLPTYHWFAYKAKRLVGKTIDSLILR